MGTKRGWQACLTIRYVIAWKLCTSVRVEDVTDPLNPALKASGCTSANAHRKPRLLSDNGPFYITADLTK